MFVQETRDSQSMNIHLYQSHAMQWIEEFSLSCCSLWNDLDTKPKFTTRDQGRR
jgi:hypothetical protein